MADTLHGASSRSCQALFSMCGTELKLLNSNSKTDNFGIVGFLFFGRIPVDLSHFSLHFDSIFMLNVLKRSLILAYGPTGGQQKDVAY
jgi:hypothetical protein